MTRRYDRDAGRKVLGRSYHRGASSKVGFPDLCPCCCYRTAAGARTRTRLHLPKCVRQVLIVSILDACANRPVLMPGRSKALPGALLLSTPHLPQRVPKRLCLLPTPLGSGRENPREMECFTLNSTKRSKRECATPRTCRSVSGRRCLRVRAWLPGSAHSSWCRRSPCSAAWPGAAAERRVRAQASSQ